MLDLAPQQGLEARPVRDESGQFLRDVRGNPLLDSVDLGVQKTLSIRCDGGTGEMTLKRARYRVLDQVVFQGDFTLRDRGSEIPRRGLIRMARNR